MAIPLWVLALLTAGIGGWLAVAGGEAHAGPGWLTTLSLALAAAGIVLAFLTYRVGVVSPVTLSRLAAPIDLLARRRYGLDAVYAGLYRGLLLGVSWLIGWIDRYLVDGVLNVVSAWTLQAGDRLRRIQTGQAQDYVYGVAFGLLVLLIASQFWR
jgi:NADH:ubiquinone oxidoreductase subunit 5 (subunit L)/multisubunit Na+/H+ antiporter MnhA subunit